MEYRYPSTNYFGLDGQSLSTEIAGLRDEAETEIANAIGALERGSRPRAALHYLSAMKPAERLAKEINIREIWEAYAELCVTLDDFKDLGVKAFAKADFRDRAEEVYTTLFAKYYRGIYRTQLEKLGVLEPDPIDYSVKQNLINRPLLDLKRIAISLQKYDILENDDGDIMISIPIEPQGEDQNAVLLCDGGEHALLFKGPYRLVICDFLHPEMRKKLLLKEEILCYEFLRESEYLAEVVKCSGVTELAYELLKLVSP
ncbi:MAG: hypothetical protein GXY17_06440 [Clostridiaceae bacterium]|jgi:hypothetical protein|nr:hypothetical protein [Clostridiaceae bacterium]